MLGTRKYYHFILLEPINLVKNELSAMNYKKLPLISAV